MKNHKGITTIELLAILIIISIIALIAVPTVNTLIRNTENRAIEASLINMEEAVRLYRLDRGERDPKSFTEVRDEIRNQDPTLIRPNINTGNANNQEWEVYADWLLGPYISGGWPKPPFGGIFSYRFYTKGGNNVGDNFPAPNIRVLKRNAQGDLVPGDSLIDVYEDIGGRGDQSGEFLQIRFGTRNQTTEQGGVFNLEDERTRVNTEDFIRTVDFLLETQFGDRIFVWHNNTSSGSLSGTADNNRAQLVILIYLDHNRWERND